MTGGSRGIGLACARRFQAGGDRVAVTWRTKPPEVLEGPAGTHPAVACRLRRHLAGGRGTSLCRDRTGARPGSGPCLRRRDHRRHPAFAHVRGALGQRHRDEPHRGLPDRKTGARAHGSGEAGPHRPDLVGCRFHGFRGPGQLRGFQGRAGGVRPLTGERGGVSQPSQSTWLPPGSWPRI